MARYRPWERRHTAVLTGIRSQFQNHRAGVRSHASSLAGRRSGLDNQPGGPQPWSVSFWAVAIVKKICLSGAPGMGKTSLVRRFVHSLFSERCRRTVGAVIEKKTVVTTAGEVGRVLRDLVGDDGLPRLLAGCLRGQALAQRTLAP